MDDDFVKKRLERDLAELKRMCDDHFQKRAADEENITELEGRMSERKNLREEQKNARLEKEKAKNEAERLAKEAKEKAEEERKANEAEEKAAILSAMSQGYDKEAARKRRGEKRRLKRRSAAIKQAQA
ncbi:Oidioi.mRNA.OKI2018_I69.chr1.g510.t1.cds [Oikopleura dioica]|uniref:Oidioi.mRNA.OKI2018_I69.chr1.g510.t1.cds n=1 Tax=Oikopleura dioica TaxID=34765 RepID=A0ABN7SUC4_OIKDI|nr:Oidioi.mRNA.OKI2018_I69.chr1.g510.t1.cds [Oikopleura dioica]